MEAQVLDLRRDQQSLEIENEKLRATLREMVEDYSRQLDARDQQIQRLESNEMIQQNEVSMLVYKENEALKQENHMLRDKVAILDEEVNRLNVGRVVEADLRALREENDRLNRQLIDKERSNERDIVDQKNEWAEIYGAQKEQVDQMHRDIANLNQENERVLRKLEMAEKRGGANVGKSGGSANEIKAELVDTAKRLRKRELECQALWDSLKDIKDIMAEQSSADLSHMMKILAKRALDSKAHRKLDLQ